MVKMDFSSYEKMPRSLQKANLNEEDFARLEKIDWVVTEKVHGANFSFIYENRILKFAKRKELLKWEDDFFAFQRVVQRIENDILQLFEALSRSFDADGFIIYGELCGGQYPHPDIEAKDPIKAIQTGIYYHPDIIFHAFDIAKIIDKKKTYLDYELALEYFEKYTIDHAQVLAKGKLNNILEFDININSTIPSYYQLPPLESNLIEGVVIKPFNHTHLEGLSKRPIFKLKNPEFEENDSFHQAKKWSYWAKENFNQEELAFLLEDIQPYINNMRLESAISKEGSLSFDYPERIKKIENEILRDGFEDFNIANENILEDLDQQQKQWLSNRIKSMIKQLIQNYDSRSN